MEITEDNIDEREDIFFISINDNGEAPILKESENVKVMFFDDVEQDYEIPIIGTNEKKKIKAFTMEQAKELVEFIFKHKDKKKCLVHCTAGVSRSGAVATFINELFGEDEKEFKNNNPYILPNKLVLKLLNQAKNELRRI